MTVTVGNRVVEATSTTGTSDFQLSGAAAGARTFKDALGGGGGEIFYTCVDSVNGTWETGWGTLVPGTPDVLQRTSVTESTNSNAKVNFASGSKTVFHAVPAQFVVFLNNTRDDLLPVAVVRRAGDTMTGALNVDNNFRVRRSGTTTQNIDAFADTNGNNIKGFSPTTAAKQIIIDSTTDSGNTAPSAGSNGILLRVRGTTRFQVNDDGTITVSGASTFTTNPVISGSTPRLSFVDSDGKSGFIDVDGSVAYLKRSAANGGTTPDSGPNSRHPWSSNFDTGDFTASGNVTAYSDKRLKKNIIRLVNGLAKVRRMMPVTYEEVSSGRARVGFVAQDMRDVVPHVVVEDAEGYLSINYGALTSVLASAIQDIDEQLKDIRRRLKALEKGNDST